MGMWQKIRLYGCLLCAGIAHVFGQTVPYEQNLEDCLQRAVAFNPQLMAFDARYQAAMARIPQAGALPDPMLTVTHFVDTVQTRNGPQDDVFMLTQKFPWMGTLKGKRASASAQAQALWYALEAARLELVENVTRLYFEYAFLDKEAALTGKHLALLKSLQATVEEKVRTGNSVNALLRLQTETVTVEDRLAGISQKKAIVRARLLALLALPETTELHLAPVVELTAPDLPDAQALHTALEDANPALKALEQRILAAGSRSRVARLQKFPDFSLGINYVSIGENPTAPAAAGSGDDAWGVTLGLSLPIWRESKEAAILEARSEKEALEKELENARYTLKTRLSTTLLALADANRRQVLYRDALIPLAEQAEENSRDGYASGQNTFFELIDSERTLLNLRLNYWKATTDVWTDYIVLQALVNQPLESLQIP